MTLKRFFLLSAAALLAANCLTGCLAGKFMSNYALKPEPHGVADIERTRAKADSLCPGGILGGCIDGVEFVAVRIHAGDILEDPLRVEVVIPGDDARAQGVGLVAGALDVGHAMGLRLEGIVGHEFAGQAAGEAVRGEKDRSRCQEGTFQCHSYRMVVISGRRWRRTPPARPAA